MGFEKKYSIGGRIGGPIQQLSNSTDKRYVSHAGSHSKPHCYSCIYENVLFWKRVKSNYGFSFSLLLFCVLFIDVVSHADNFDDFSQTNIEKKPLDGTVSTNGKPENELNAAKPNNSQYNNKMNLGSNNNNMNIGCTNSTQISNQISNNSNINSSDNKSNIPIVPKVADKSNQGKLSVQHAHKSPYTIN